MAEDSRVEEGTLGNFNFWMTQSRDSREEMDVGLGPQPFFARDGETLFRIFQIPPAPRGLTPQDAKGMVDGFFAGIGDPRCRVDTTRHPLMHTTPTTDYVVLLDGEISLLLDTGDPLPLKRFDAVVQRATNHFWVNTGMTTATLVAVMVGRDDPPAASRS